MRHIMTKGAILLALQTSACNFDGWGWGNGNGSGSAEPGEEQVEPELTCFFGPDPAVPAATIEHVLEVVNGLAVVKVRLTLDPRFVDNTYGKNALGWSAKGHTFKDLVGSDHAQFQLRDGAGAVVSELKLDYITADAAMPSGYRSLGVTGGDGQVPGGHATAIVASSTSMERNFNERGLASYTVDSPATDEAYTANPTAPTWDYRVIYEFAIRADAFGAAGFGAVTIPSIHASPSKAGENTLVVEPGPCPPEWGGYCNDPDGCDPGTGLPPGCNDPDGCDPGTGAPPECTLDADCPTGEFCEGGACYAPIGSNGRWAGRGRMIVAGGPGPEKI